MTATDVRASAGLGAVVLARDELATSALTALLIDAGVAVSDSSQSPPVGAIAVVLDSDEATSDRLAETGLRAVVISDGEPDESMIVDAVLKGVCGFVDSGCSTDELVRAMDAIARDGSALSPRHTRLVIDALRQRGRASVSATLTLREQQILQAIADGESVKQTARRLGVSPRTIDNTQRIMFLKLGVRNRAHAVSRAHELGLLDSEKH